MSLDWMIVYSRSQKPIGAIGFIGDKIAVVSTFYEDKDWDHSGDVEWDEHVFSFFGLGGKALAEVLTRAYSDPAILMRDHSLRGMYGQAVQQFAGGMIVEGVYRAYLGMGVSRAAGAIAAQLVNNGVMRFFIRKGMETAVRRLVLAGAGR